MIDQSGSTPRNSKGISPSKHIYVYHAGLQCFHDCSGRIIRSSRHRAMGSTRHRSVDCGHMDCNKPWPTRGSIARLWPLPKREVNGVAVSRLGPYFLVLFQTAGRLMISSSLLGYFSIRLKRAFMASPGFKSASIRRSLEICGYSAGL